MSPLAAQCDSCQLDRHEDCTEFYCDCELWVECRCGAGGHPWDDE